MYIVIGKSNCSYCSDLRAELNKKNIPYTYLDQRYCHADILDIYIYIYIYVCMYICMYIYIYKRILSST